MIYYNIVLLTKSECGKKKASEVICSFNVDSILQYIRVLLSYYPLMYTYKNTTIIQNGKQLYQNI